MAKKAKKKKEEVTEGQDAELKSANIDSGNVFPVSEEHANEIAKRLTEVSKLEIAIGRLNLQKKEILKKIDVEEANIEQQIKTSREKFKSYFDTLRELYITKGDPGAYEYVEQIRSFRLPQQSSGIKLVSKDEHKH